MTQIKEIERQKMLDSEGGQAADALDFISKKIANRDAISERNLKLIKGDTLPDEEEYYEKDPEAIKSETQESVSKKFLYSSEKIEREELKREDIRRILNL